MSENIICRREPGVVFLAFNRVEKKNAITGDMYRALTQFLAEAKSDDTVKAVVLEGEGECFTAGNDLVDFMSMGNQQEAPPVFPFLDMLSTFPKPVVVALKGHCVGIGATLLLHADLVYAEEDTLFSLPFVKLGLCPEFASSYLMSRLAGHVRAFEWLVLGESFSAEQALQAGIINAIEQDALQEAADKAHELAKLPPKAVLTCKRLLREPLANQIKDVMNNENQAFREGLQGQEFAEVVAEFFRKRG